MKVMSGLDARFYYSSTPTVHMHTIKVVVVDTSGSTNVIEGGTIPRDLLIAMIDERLPRMPALRRRVLPAPFNLGNPIIIDDPDFDITRHLRFRVLDAPGDQRELDRAIGKITGTPLPTDRPLWELTVVEGLEGGQIAFVMKVHHALADGVASAAMMQNAFVLDEQDAVVESFRPHGLPRRRDRLRYAASGAAHAFRTMPRVARQTIGGSRRARLARREETAALGRPFAGPRTPFNVALTADRTFGTVSLDRAAMRGLMKIVGVSLNDVFLSLAAGAIRRYLTELGDPPETSLVTSMPMATRLDQQRLAGNHVDNIFMPLHSDIADASERARMIHESSVAARRIRKEFGAELFELRSGLVPAGFHGVLPRLWGMTGLADRTRPPLNLITSYVRGPRNPLEFQGARVTRLYSCGPILEGIGLNVTAWSYIDRVYVSFLGCSASLPDPSRLADQMTVELDSWLATV